VNQHWIYPARERNHQPVPHCDLGLRRHRLSKQKTIPQRRDQSNRIEVDETIECESAGGEALETLAGIASVVSDRLVELGEKEGMSGGKDDQDASRPKIHPGAVDFGLVILDMFKDVDVEQRVEVGRGLAVGEGSNLNTATGRQSPNPDLILETTGQGNVGLETDPAIGRAVAEKLGRAAKPGADLEDITPQMAPDLSLQVRFPVPGCGEQVKFFSDISGFGHDF